MKKQTVDDEVMAVLGRLRARFPDQKFVIVTDGPDSRAMSTSIKSFACPHEIAQLLQRVCDRIGETVEDCGVCSTGN